MAIDIRIPKLGMTMTKAKVAQWQFAEGEYVKEKEVVLVIETEKVTYQVEALGSGFLFIVVAAGLEAEVGEVVGILAETEEELEKVRSDPAKPGGEASSGGESSGETPFQSPVRKETPVDTAARGAGKIKVSPRAKRLALAHGLDLAGIQPSGPGGRIVEKDIEKALQAGDVPGSTSQARAPEGEFAGEVLDGKRVKKTVPLQGMRQAISEHMLRSLQVSAQLTAGTEVDMTELIRFRNSQNKRDLFQDSRLSFTDIFVYIIARVLREQPLMNASLVDGNIVMWEDINIGVAVSTAISGEENGLVVPVVRNAGSLSLAETSRSVKEIVDRARRGSLTLDDMTGGTFTLTNTGTFGGRWSWATPVLNQPEVGILQTAAVVERVVPVDGVITVKPLMPLILTFDHRVMDGYGAARFTNRLADLIEDPCQLVD